MSKTTAERQAAYRAGRFMARENGEHRLNTWVSTETHFALRRLARHHGVTQKQILERLIKAEDDRILASLDMRTPAWDGYFGVKKAVTA